MIKRLAVGLVIVMVSVLVMVAIWRVATKDSNQETASADTTQTADKTATTDSAAVPQPAKYAVYNTTDVASDNNTKLLFFHAPWCPQCRALDTDITKNISAESGVSIYKVDYDSNQALRQKYGVTLQTTVVRIDDAGNLVEKYVAYNEPTFANLKKNLL